MKEFWKDSDLCVKKELILPVFVKASQGMRNCEELLNPKAPCISFDLSCTACFAQKGAYVVLDFGKEIAGGLRFLTREITDTYAQVRITLGESFTEACSQIGEKNATNHHAPRDFVADLTNLSDLSFGQSGFRFARIELLTECPVSVRNIYAVNTLPAFERTGCLKTEDALLNQIIETAGYTLDLVCQNGYIWDGIKRDRLVWSGDLNPEILTCLYMHGDNYNVPNSLTALRQAAPAEEWMNDIPSYSAWWVVNLCDYCRFTGNTAFYEQNRDYSAQIMKNINNSVASDGTIAFDADPNVCMLFFLDWPTCGTEDAQVGTAALLLYAAQRMLEMEDNQDCRELCQKLLPWLDKPSTFKQVRAFQILAGRRAEGDAEFLEKGGAEGMSTFMAYYILKADTLAGGKGQIKMIKDYFGGMISRGATSFWEDFDISWLEGSGRIDQLPEPRQKDIHGDYGAFCYQGLRHSLCHGWASGVLAFLYEYLLGVQMKEYGKYEVKPVPMGIDRVEGQVPVPGGMLQVKVEKDTVNFKEL